MSKTKRRKVLMFQITSAVARAIVGVLNSNMSPKKAGAGKDDRSPDEQKKEDNNHNSKKPNKEPKKESDKHDRNADHKDYQKDSPKSPPKDSQKNSKNDAPKNSQKDAPKDAPKHSQNNGKNATPKNSQKDSAKHAPKDSHKDVHKDVHKGSQKNVQKDSPNHFNKDGEVDVPKDINQDGERAADKDNHKDDPHDDYDHAVTTAKGTHQASKNRSASTDILREILRRQLADEGHAPAAALPGNQPRLAGLVQAQQLYAPLGSSGVVPVAPSHVPDYYGMSTVPQSMRNLGFGSCSCHPACNCQKPCSCEPSPCACKGPRVSSIHSAGSGTIISSVVPIPVPYPMPGYDGGAGGSGNNANARPNEPIIINPYPPSTSSAPPQPPAPANPAPITVHDIVSLMTSLMLKNFRDDLLRRWGLPVPDDATSAAATPVRATVPESAAITAPQVAVPGPSLQAAPVPNMALPYILQQPTSFVPFAGPRPQYPSQLLPRVENEPRASSAPAPRRRHHSVATTHKHAASGRRTSVARIEDLEMSDSQETQELSMASGSKGSSKGPRDKGGRRGRK